ncbi:hypothetical protein JCM16358_06340 [Halanaerocella petrolearia]
MQKASKFEVWAARAWNLLNEGKSFYPIFSIGIFLLYHYQQWTNLGFWQSTLLVVLINLPLVITYIRYDFPLTLRWFLWIPLAGFIIGFNYWDLKLIGLDLGVYLFFTVIFWGTIYYHLRIGTTLTNFTRFWKLVLKNSDSTSGNFQEQIPKTLVTILSLNYSYLYLTGQLTIRTSTIAIKYIIFFLITVIGSIIIDHKLFNWKPEQYQELTNNVEVTESLTNRVIMIIIDGCRKDRLAEAETPFIDQLREEGTEYTKMETIYPARTVTCFSSLFTGTYPDEHGIKSNLVLDLGIKTESIFDKLREEDKKGKLLGIAHLIDAFGEEDVEAITAVMDNDQADGHIIKRAKDIMKKEAPELLVTQLISTDQTGHSRGALYSEYKEKIEEADRHINGFVNWLTEEGYMEDTTLIIAADHGQSDGIGGHGHLDEGERYVPFIINGPQIKAGFKIEEKRSIVSTAPTISYLLGVDYPDSSRGPVLTEAIDQS